MKVLRTGRVLAVTTDPMLTEAVVQAGAEVDYAHLILSCGEDAVNAARGANPTVLLLDVDHAESGSLALIPALHEANPFVAILVITRNASLEQALAAFRMGATDYLFGIHAREILAAVGCAARQSELWWRNGFTPSDDRASLSLREVERRHITYVLEQYKFNCSRAARVLAVDRTTLYNKMKLFGLVRPKRRSAASARPPTVEP